jgi:hypothetical protein
MEQVMEMLKTMQEKADANTKAMQELQNMMKANQEDLKSGQAKMIAAIEKKTDALIANIKNARKETTACQEVTGANPEKMESNSVEEETVLEQQEIPNEEVAVQTQRTCQSETTASQDATETKPDPGTMQSAEEHQEIPKEDAAVMPVGGLRKRRRDRNLAAGRPQKPKKRIQATFEFKRRSAAACRKVSRRARVAWRKRNIFRRIVTQGNCGLRKRLVVTSKRTTRCATVAWRKRNIFRRIVDCERDW